MNKRLALTEALKISKNIPCSVNLKKLIIDEVNSGNFIKSFDQVSLNNDESYYILIFENNNMNDYPNIKTMHKKDGSTYNVIVFVDSKGCTEIRFNY